ncbi:MAG: hypothetical protein HY706_20070 [Candidatus Hydrogenedentes bacterium]|nr:hypothetical protein [Candidatus Hydrogenedentota bacterium]
MITPLMPLEGIDDWERRLARQDAFWECAILDRPVVCMTIPKETSERPRPTHRSHTSYPSYKDWWFDTDRVVEEAVARVANADFFGDALPYAWPNLGPELFSAFFGMEMDYSADSGWGIPNLANWSQVHSFRFSGENPYWRKLVQMTDALLAAARGRFYVGITDLHPGGDAIAAFRDPTRLNLDLLERPEEVKALLGTVNQTYFYVYDFFYNKLASAGQAVASWPGIVSTKKWYVPSNDFSCMISEAAFEEFFLPGIIEECRHLEASIYHLDGPNALRHLDQLLEINELNAIQWVYGAGHGRATDWLHVYQRCQAAGKGVQILAEADELDTIMRQLRPEGVWLSVSGIKNRTEAEAVLRQAAKWR